MNLPSRIVCLTEETTELLYLLGEETRIVGISAYTVRPPVAKEQKPKVSAFISGNRKKILSLEPDLVVGFSDIQASLAHDLIKEGLNVLILNQRSLEEILNSILLLGTIVGREEKTRQLILEWTKKIESIRMANLNLQTPKVFFQEWDEPIISGIQWVSELIHIAGGEDIFATPAPGKMAKDRIVSAADVADKDPDVIIGSWCGKPMDRDWIINHPEWQDVKAIQNKQIFEIDSSIILQPGPALFLEGIDAMSQCIQEWRDTYSCSDRISN